MPVGELQADRNPLEDEQAVHRRLLGRHTVDVELLLRGGLELPPPAVHLTLGGELGIGRCRDEQTGQLRDPVVVRGGVA